MTRSSTKREWRKCALQVNPYSYSGAYNSGQDHALEEDDYNEALLQACVDNEIELIALTDHGCIEGFEKIRELFEAEGIVVLPGFEFTTSEKVHLICLFPEDTPAGTIKNYLFDLAGTDSIGNDVAPKTSGVTLIEKVDAWGGLTYAAHCHEDNGVLHHRVPHIWQHPRLLAAQIKGTLEEFNQNVDCFFQRVIANREANYRRDHSLALINACDIKKPSDLSKPNATCCIKMTEVGFRSLKHALEDPEHCVRLDCEGVETHSVIEAVEIIGGFLSDVKVELSPELNTVIGGRGTGKSTFIECIRWALGFEPRGEEAQKRHLKLISKNLGEERGTVKVRVRSNAQQGRRFLVSRTWGDTPVVTDLASEKISALGPADLLPQIEFYGHNEIHEIAQNPRNQTEVLERFLELDDGSWKDRLDETRRALKNNRLEIQASREDAEKAEEMLNELEKVTEQLSQFEGLNLQEKLESLAKIEKERNLLQRLRSEQNQLGTGLKTLADSLPDLTFLSDKTLAELPNKAALILLREETEALKQNFAKSVEYLEKLLTDKAGLIRKMRLDLEAEHEKQEKQVEKTFKDIPDSQGKSGRELGFRYKDLVRRQETLKAGKGNLEAKRAWLQELQQRRQQLLEEWKELTSRKVGQQRRALKRLNRKLRGKLQVDLKPASERRELVDFLLQQSLPGVGDARLRWVLDRDDISPIGLARFIRTKDSEALQSLGATTGTAEALLSLPGQTVLELEEIVIPDKPSIELNVSHDPAQPEFKDVDDLSSGQKCTALLHLLLLENSDPLVIDQPEDNLDNAFIAERIVAQLQTSKKRRQFLFATHNANIPVFGGADWIGVLSTTDARQGQLPAEQQGSVDSPEIQRLAADILEGGKQAFLARQKKYGFESPN